MKGGNIKAILNRFVEEHVGKEVTVLFVKKWIEEMFGVDISTKRLGQYLIKNKSFIFVKKLNKGTLYRINPLEAWMKDLRTV